MEYDALTGLLRWKDRPELKPNDRARLTGTVAGHANSGGHIQIMISGELFLAHRLIWKLVTGNEPDDEIDHKNSIGSDNRWDNLRQATSAQNTMNSRRRRNNKSGYKGVYWNKKSRKWETSIRMGGKCYYLGGFDDPKDAHEAYVEAAKRLHGEFARVA
ncbi:HNH endonuclease [Methylobacterium ajmalii]|uniref:HNH endonuclease n=1 Tax=Methylobacterium ajmalii TaxID=2738439 RepID=A0ABV0A4X8_9HYPH